LNNPDTAWDLWVVVHGLDWKFLPSQIAAEPEAPLQDCLTIEAAYQAIKERNQKDAP